MQRMCGIPFQIFDSRDWSIHRGMQAYPNCECILQFLEFGPGNGTPCGRMTLGISEVLVWDRRIYRLGAYRDCLPSAYTMYTSDLFGYVETRLDSQPL
jgi:hypothetical protein